jgi:S1-C subfamily serine protease
MKILSGALAAATLMLAPASAFSHGQKKSDTGETESSETLDETDTSQGRLGLEVMGLTPDLRKHFSVGSDRGVLIAKVEKGSPADKAGLEAGDILLSVNGQSVKQASDVLDGLANTQEGQTIKLVVVRDKKQITTIATMKAAGPTTSEMEFLHNMPWFGTDSDQDTPT